jgi:chromosome segregation ATPase
MNKLAKLAPIIVILACVGSLFFAFKLSGVKAQLKSDNAQLTEDRDTAHRQLAADETQLKSAKAQLDQAQSDLATANAEKQAAQVSLGEKTQEADQLKTQLADKDQDLQKTRTDLSSAQDSMKKIQDSLQAAGVTDIGNIDQLRDKLAAQGDENKLLGQELLTLRQHNQQLQEQVEASTTTPTSLRGRVADVQDSWNFVVLNLGRQERVQTNTQFMVYRDSKPVGMVQVTSVGSATSIAEILPEYRHGTPQVGDLVVH